MAWNPGIEAPQFTPQPLNLFMNIPVHEDRTSLSFDPPTGKPGEFISLKAEVDLVVAFSACPQVGRAFSVSEEKTRGSGEMREEKRLTDVIGYSEDQWWRAEGGSF